MANDSPPQDHAPPTAMSQPNTPDAELTTQENVALWIGGLTAGVPTFVLAGFMQELNFLSNESWVAIAAGGSALAGAIGTPRRFRGMLCAVLASMGMMAAIVYYVDLRMALIDSTTFFSPELIIAGMVGAAPGTWLYLAWARAKPDGVAEASHGLEQPPE